LLERVDLSLIFGINLLILRLFLRVLCDVALARAQKITDCRQWHVSRPRPARPGSGVHGGRQAAEIVVPAMHVWCLLRSCFSPVLFLVFLRSTIHGGAVATTIALPRPRDGPRGRRFFVGRLGMVQHLVLRAWSRRPCRPGVAGVFLPARPAVLRCPASTLASWHVISAEVKPVATGFLSAKTQLVTG
jgi:hypothetical protein